MITVCLYGDLKEFAKDDLPTGRFKFHASSPAEALRLLVTQINGMKEYIAKGQYQVRFQGQDYTEESIQATFSDQAESGVLHVVPRTMGAGKGGWGQVILGVIIIAVMWWNPMSWAAGGSMLAAGFAMGTSLVLGGIAQLLTKPPSLDDFNRKGEKASRNSSFTNLQNTAAQGNPVPVAIGRVRCGARVISQGVTSRRVDTQNDPVLTNPTAGVILDVQKTFIKGVAAIAPNGQPYNTDFDDDSVKARNYTAVVRSI